MSIQKRLAKAAGRKHLWFTLAILSLSLIVQRQFAQSAAKSDEEAYAQHIDQIIQESQSLRQQRLDNGSLWLGGLHEKLPGHQEDSTPSPSSMSLAGQRRVSIDSIPLGSDNHYRLAMEIHECSPGSTACASGGTIRVTTAAGEPLFSCDMGLLLADPTKPSYYALLWDKAAETLTHEERQQVLEELAGENAHPSAATFFENLQLAYLHDNHQTGLGREQAMRLWQNVLSAIIADQANSPIP